MLNFQTDYDEHTGEQVLTCFLLPQMEYQNEENMGKDSRFLFSLNRPDKCRVELEQNLLWTSNVVSVLRVASKRPMKLRMPARGKECLASFFVSGEGTRTLLLSSYVVHTRCWEDKMQDIGDVHIVNFFSRFFSPLFPSSLDIPHISVHTKRHVFIPVGPSLRLPAAHVQRRGPRGRGKRRQASLFRR